MLPRLLLALLLLLPLSVQATTGIADDATATANEGTKERVTDALEPWLRQLPPGVIDVMERVEEAIRTAFESNNSKECEPASARFVALCAAAECNDGFKRFMFPTGIGCSRRPVVQTMEVEEFQLFKNVPKGTGVFDVTIPEGVCFEKIKLGMKDPSRLQGTDTESLQVQTCFAQSEPRVLSPDTTVYTAMLTKYKDEEKRGFARYLFELLVMPLIILPLCWICFRALTLVRPSGLIVRIVTAIVALAMLYALLGFTVFASIYILKQHGLSELRANLTYFTLFEVCYMLVAGLFYAVRKIVVQPQVIKLVTTTTTTASRVPPV